MDPFDASIQALQRGDQAILGINSSIRLSRNQVDEWQEHRQQRNKYL